MERLAAKVGGDRNRAKKRVNIVSDHQKLQIHADIAVLLDA